MKTGARHFDADYDEQVQLHDGRRLRLRLLRPEDGPALARGFERLSPRSRYLRFVSPKGKLASAEIDYLTRVDGHDHVALAAIGVDGELAGEGVGIARFVRLPDEPTAAEAAVAVADDWQGAGMGKLLLDRLAQAARERGIHHFRAEVLAENAAMLAVARDLGADARPGDELDEVIVDMDLHAPAGSAAGEALQRLLSLAARGLLVLKRRGVPGGGR